MLYRFYKILSGENWNGQTKVDDFKEVKLIAEIEVYDMFQINDLLECFCSEDVFYEVCEV